MNAIDKSERHASVWLASLVYLLYASGGVGGGGVSGACVGGDGDSGDGTCVCCELVAHQYV